ncbi:hypothetical protein LTS00_004316 [Friedmanniomyces endolithicus]|nr:hypothetical protein LTS00_004316 [Friedmanniomyces endolithicus]
MFEAASHHLYKSISPLPPKPFFQAPKVMADGLSIAASAIQVADAGFKLYGALSQYIRDYVDANKHVRRLADEVRTTSWALQQLGALLKEDDDIKLCKPEAIGETEAALKGCQRAFDEVSDIIKGFLPSSKPDVRGVIARSSISNRWKWPLKTAKVQLLLAQLERLKTTLLLIFKVITYASKLASKYVKASQCTVHNLTPASFRTSQKEIFLPDEKSQLLYLLKAKHDAVKVEEKLLAYVVQQPPSTEIVKPEVSLGAYGQYEARLQTNKTPFDSTDGAPASRGISESTDEPLSYPGLTSTARAEPMPLPMSYANFVGAVLLPEQFEIPERSLSPICNDTTRPKEAPRLSGRKRGLVARLDDYVAAVERLTLTLNHAKAELQSDNPLVVHHVTRSFRSTKRAIDALVSTEMDADSDSATSDRGLGYALGRLSQKPEYKHAGVDVAGLETSYFYRRSRSSDAGVAGARRSKGSVAVAASEVAGRVRYRPRSRSSRSRSRLIDRARLPMAVTGGLAGARLHHRGTDEPQLDLYGSSTNRPRSRRTRSRSRREVAAGPPMAPAGALAQASVAELYERVTTRPHDEPRSGAYAYANPSALVASDTTQEDWEWPIPWSALKHDATTKPAGTRTGHETGDEISSNPLSEQTSDNTLASVRKKITTLSSAESAFRSLGTGLQLRQLSRSSGALAESAAPPNPKNDSSTAEYKSSQITELKGSAPGDAKHAETKSSIRPLDEPQSTLSGMVTGPQRLHAPRRSGVLRGHRKKISAPGLNPRVSTGSLDDISPNNAIANPAPDVARNSPPSVSPPDLGLDLGDPRLVSPASQILAGSTEHAIPPIHLESIACDDDIDDDAWSLYASYDMDSLDLGLESAQSGKGKARSMKASLVLPQDSPESKAVDTTNPRAADKVALDRDRMPLSDAETRRAVSRSDEYYQSPPGLQESISPETYDVVVCGEDSDMDGGPEAEGEICDGAEEESEMDGGPEEEGEICDGAEEEGEICDGAEGESDMDGGAEEEGDLDGGAEEESADVAYETYDSVGSGEISDTEGNGEEESEDMVDALVRRWTTVPI